MQLLETKKKRKRRNGTFNEIIEVKLKRCINEPESPPQIKDRACTVTIAYQTMRASSICLRYAACLSLS